MKTKNKPLDKYIALAIIHPNISDTKGSDAFKRWLSNQLAR
jgi:hypothetical protein